MEYRNNFSTMIVFNKFRAEICKLLGFSEILTYLCREVFPGNSPSYTYSYFRTHVLLWIV